ncbi:hypothetical protein C8R48DRAFT_668263 [Suillus tomentosus]|nr:hypothetical protein C8R48DRAFT_668263 [Suillus tomentosus]
MNRYATKPHQAHEFCKKTEKFRTHRSSQISPLKPVGPEKLNPSKPYIEVSESNSHVTKASSRPLFAPAAIEDRPKRIPIRIIISAALMLGKKRLRSASKITESIPCKSGLYSHYLLAVTTLEPTGLPSFPYFRVADPQASIIGYCLRTL